MESCRFRPSESVPASANNHARKGGKQGTGDGVLCKPQTDYNLRENAKCNTSALLAIIVSPVPIIVSPVPTVAPPALRGYIHRGDDPEMVPTVQGV